MTLPSDAPEASSHADPSAETFAAPLRRIEVLIPALAILAIVVLVVSGSWPLAVGFLVGAGISYVNFRWLKSTVAALADAITQNRPPRSRPSVVFRFVTRFVLIALAAYVILSSYPLAFHGFLGGLFVPVLAILVEGVIVVSASSRSKI